MTSYGAAPTQTLDLVVVGGGISGLTCADIAIQNKLSIVLLEARNRIGGRCLSFHGIDLGASWGWPPYEAEGIKLAKLNGVNILQQRLGGSSLQLQHGKMNVVGELGDSMAPCGPDAVRFEGGYSMLAEKLAEKLDEGQLILGATVTRIEQSRESINVSFNSLNSTTRVLQTKRVVIAIPPAVLARTITFKPALGAQKLHKMASTATWCGDWCKVVAIFKTNFWRKNGLSGVISTDGMPVSIWWEGGSGEQNEVSAIAGLGFGVDACQSVNAMINESELRSFIVKVLGAAFPGGENYVNDQLVSVGGKAWAIDPLTFDPNAQEQDYGHPLLKQTTGWGVFFAGSESEKFNGHVEGAIVAGRRAAHEVIYSLRQ